MRELLEKILKIPTIIQSIGRKERKYVPLDAVIYEINAEFSRLVEPVLSVEVWVDGDMPCFDITWHSFPTNWTPGEYKLFTHTNAKPVLLSDEEIEWIMKIPDVWYGFNGDKIDWKTLIPIVERALLRKNGLGGVE